MNINSKFSGHIMKFLFLAFWLVASTAHSLDADRTQYTRKSAGTATISSQLLQAIQSHQSNIQVSGEGRVIKILADDNSGNRHQKFILRIASGNTLLIAHNIDLAPRISSLREGDNVSFYGEYEWNPKGGVIHWTHHDPQGRHESGWLKHNGRLYQ
jgi:hypothetical protein